MASCWCTIFATASCSVFILCRGKCLASLCNVLDGLWYLSSSADGSLAIYLTAISNPSVLGNICQDQPIVRRCFVNIFMRDLIKGVSCTEVFLSIFAPFSLNGVKSSTPQMILYKYESVTFLEKKSRRIAICLSNSLPISDNPLPSSWRGRVILCMTILGL